VVFADGATVTSTIPSGSTIGTGVISGCTVKTAGADTDTLVTCTLSNISLTNYSIDTWHSLINTNLTNVTISGCSLSGISYGYVLFYTYNDEECMIANSTINIAQTACYAMSVYRGGKVHIKDSTIGKEIYLGSIGQAVEALLTLSGMTSVTIINPAATTQSGQVRILSGSTITASSIIASTSSSTYPSTLSVGVYVDDVWTPATTSAGAATVIIGGTTMHVWGTGTRIDSNGTDLQHD
jgi:hypothetical protein